MKISLIAALSENHVIGSDGKIPWHLPDDLKRFRMLTLGKPVIMGRKTYESIGRLLPGRPNIILTRSLDYRVEGAHVVASLSDAVKVAEGLVAAKEDNEDKEAFVIGGGEVYRLAMPIADRMYLTYVNQTHQGDATFPEWNCADFYVENEENHSDAVVPFRYVTLQRVERKLLR